MHLIPVLSVTAIVCLLSVESALSQADINIQTGNMHVSVGANGRTIIQTGGPLRVETSASQLSSSYQRSWDVRRPQSTCNNRPYGYRHQYSYQSQDGQIQTYSSNSTWICQSSKSSQKGVETPAYRQPSVIKTE